MVRQVGMDSLDSNQKHAFLLQGLHEIVLWLSALFFFIKHLYFSAAGRISSPLSIRMAWRFINVFSSAQWALRWNPKPPIVHVENGFGVQSQAVGQWADDTEGGSVVITEGERPRAECAWLLSWITTRIQKVTKKSTPLFVLCLFFYYLYQITPGVKEEKH